MSLSAIARRMLRAGAITALAGVAAFGSGTALAGSAGLAPAGSVPSTPSLGSVSCPVVSMCMVVGQAGGTGDSVPTAATWNGRTWRWLAQPPERQRDSGLSAVACLSASRCIAIGNSDASATPSKGVAFGEEWNGAAWHLLPALAGPTFTEAKGLSCVNTAYCLAVGGSGIFGSLANAVAEFWNGIAWTRLTPLIPAKASAFAFDSVSCPSRSHCLAVGSFWVGTAESALAESWNGSTWTIQTAPSAIPAFAGVSCPRPKLCLAIAPGPAAVLWNGSTWRLLTTPAQKGFTPTLAGISCPSASRCIAVGGTADFPFADEWTGGTSLVKLAVPDQAGELPDLLGVSCPNASRCLAVGSLLTEFTDVGNLAAGWNGSAWRVIRENNSDVLSGVSCVTSSDCLAVGRYLTTADATTTLAQSWSGRAWRLVSRSGLRGDFSDVSCVSRSFCMAVGVDRAATWNGSTWKVITAGTDELALRSTVSCASSRFCVATDGSGLAIVWNGVKWRQTSDAFPASAATGDLSGVSCLSASFCVGVGSYQFNFQGEPFAALVNIWNGRTWQLVSTPRPGTDSTLSAVSCASRTACMAVGSYVDARKAGHDLALRLSGGKWRVVPMPGGVGFLVPGDPIYIVGPSSVSCSSAASCLAVGSFPAAHGQQEVADVWNGTAWRQTKPAGPPSGLASVSCTSPAFCMAVGQDANLALTESWNGHAWKLLTEPNP